MLSLKEHPVDGAGDISFAEVTGKKEATGSDKDHGQSGEERDERKTTNVGEKRAREDDGRQCDKRPVKASASGDGSMWNAVLNFKDGDFSWIREELGEEAMSLFQQVDVRL